VAGKIPGLSISLPGVAAALGADVGPWVKTLEVGGAAPGSRFAKYAVRLGSLRCDCVRLSARDPGAAGEAALLLRRCSEAALFWRDRLALPTTGGRTGAGDEMPGTDGAAVAVELRALVLDAVRWWRRVVVRGWEKPEVEVRCCWDDDGSAATWVDSVPEALAEVEDALDTTEAFWAARRRKSSRARRFTWPSWVSHLDLCCR
jgi:hypothetical protein